MPHFRVGGGKENGIDMVSSRVRKCLMVRQPVRGASTEGGCISSLTRAMYIDFLSFFQKNTLPHLTLLVGLVQEAVMHFEQL